MKFQALALILILTQCTTLPGKTVAPEPVAAVSNTQLMDTTVQIHVKIEATLMTTDDDGEPLEVPIEDGWVGSGVVFDKSTGQFGPVHSRILSANHVLQTPKVGSVEEMVVSFLGIEIPIGLKRIDAVSVTLTTADGKTCNVRPLLLGHNDTRDVAVAEADCDAGRVAKIASKVPVRGEKVTVVGYPLGVPLPIVTEGVVSGWLDGFLLTSAPAYGGNSGGPVFYNGEVIGLLVRGSRTYPHLTLTTSLDEVLTRIEMSRFLTVDFN